MAQESLDERRPGTSWNLEFIKMIPEKYGKGLMDRLKFIDDLVEDFEKAGIKIKFEK